MTQLRAAIRKVLAALGAVGSPLAGQVRAVLRRDDDYAGPGKPPCDWDDPQAREALVDELVSDALAALGALDGQAVPLTACDAVDLLALVAGQDVEQGKDGVFRIARKTAKDRVISTVDTQARHGHKSRNRRFDGYKAHLSVDPDSELIDEVAATPANTPDRSRRRTPRRARCWALGRLGYPAGWSRWVSAVWRRPAPGVRTAWARARRDPARMMSFLARVTPV